MFERALIRRSFGSLLRRCGANPHRREVEATSAKEPGGLLRERSLHRTSASFLAHGAAERSSSRALQAGSREISPCSQLDI